MSLSTHFRRLTPIIAASFLLTIYGALDASASTHRSHYSSHIHSRHHDHSDIKSHRLRSVSHSDSRHFGSHQGSTHTARTGKATIYSDKFNGRKTTTGERFRQDKLTAASPCLPLGSKVKVTNKSTGKSVTLKINDKQPPGGNKVVDLSKSAAQKLGIKGTGNVQTKVVGE